MLLRGLSGAFMLLSLAMTSILPAPARAELEVDLALVLAVDVSRSMDVDEQRLQRDGFVEAVAQGITINGLPFMLKRPTGMGDIENLDLYYQDCVIGGPGAFIVPVREAQQFAAAIRTKLVREIAGVAEPEPLVRLAQERERFNCLAGEMQRRRQWEP